MGKLIQILQFIRQICDTNLYCKFQQQISTTDLQIYPLQTYTNIQIPIRSKNGWQFFHCLLQNWLHGKGRITRILPSFLACRIWGNFQRKTVYIS